MADCRCRRCSKEVGVSLTSLRILLVDQDARRRSMLAERVRGLGHTVVAEAAGERQALDLARQMRTDVIVAAATLPQGGALTLAERARVEAIAPVVLVADPDGGKPVGWENAWGWLPPCAAGPVMAAALAVAARLFREECELEWEKRRDRPWRKSSLTTRPSGTGSRRLGLRSPIGSGS